MEVRLEYRVNLTTPLHIGTGMGFAQMVDDTLVRAMSKEKSGSYAPDLRVPYIPGSSLKGKLRYQTQRLADLFGIKVCARTQEERVCKKKTLYSVSPVRLPLRALRVAVL